MTRKFKARDLGKGGSGRRSSPQFSSILFFVFALSQFHEPDYIGAWNRLVPA